MLQERRNSLFRRAFHRIVGRALTTNPGLLDEGRAVVRAWKRDERRASFVDEWESILSGSVEDVRREIVRRTPDLDRLRSSSPFYLTPTRVLSPENRLRLRSRTSRLATAR